MKCPKCQGETEGWKCAICSTEADNHDANHNHVEGDQGRYCTQKCKGCAKADVHCTCEQAAEPA